MSSSIHDTEIAAPIQGVSWNEEDWQGMLKRLPSNWQEQAVKLKAWQRVRKLAQVTDLLRALLVYAACGYSFRQLGLWATLVGVGCLSERAWRKRVERAQEWIAWLLGALIGSQAAPGWVASISGRILLVDGSRRKVGGGRVDDGRVHRGSAQRASGVWVRDDKHQGRIAVRLVISLLPRKQAMQARARKQERLRRKKGTKANLAPAWWAGVMIIGTTLPQESWSAQDVVKLYRARWQI